ncbi:hypothetical protein Q8F55_006488 [Vanrija albida]|uniref:RPA43 OB domain-containing protein n=1 Tax=Vanrija albida TaxID=181172 RepID=A0ABR3PXG3_9TREE
MSAPNAVASSSKHKDRKHKDKSSKKSKEHKHKHHSKNKLPKAERSAVDGPFEHRVQRMRLSVPPKFSADWLEGVCETLDGMLMRYVPQLGGVLLAHTKHEFVDDMVRIINECPFGVVEVQFHSIVWAPKVGQVLYGTHSLSSPSHISLLFAKTFNVSIPLNHIPLGKFEFEHTDSPDEDDESSDEEDDGDMFGGSPVHEVGRWKETATGSQLGAGGARVRFTVIDLHVTNHMLSLTGSLLDDPSQAPALPAAAAAERELSLSPELPDLPPVKVARVAPKRAAPVVPAAPAIDESNLNARELKKLRKEQEKAKRDARKARKEQGGFEDEKDDDGAAPTGAKRKAESGGDGERKKRKGE